MTNELGTLEQGVKAAEALINQVQAWPVSVAMVACLIVIHYALRLAHLFPDRAIPLAILVAGCALNSFVGDVARVSPTVRHPQVVLAIFGVLLAFLSLLIYGMAIKRFEKFLPLLHDAAAEQPTTKPNNDPKQ